MTASITFYQTFKRYVADGTIDVDNDTFAVALTTSSYSPSASADTTYASITSEVAAANGYATGGATMSSVTYTESAGTATWTAANTTWTASGGSIVARYAVIYKVSPTANGITKPLVAYILMDTTPADVTTTTGNTLTLSWNASGIWTLT